MPERATRPLCRSVGLLLLGALLSPLQVVAAAPAHAGPRVHNEEYVQLNAFWHLRRPAKGVGYKKITWYAGAYRTDDFFYSDLYRYVNSCKPRPGSDRCRRTGIELGATSSSDEAKLVVADDLRSGTLEGTYSLQQKGGRPGRTVTVRVELSGAGRIDRSQHEKERWVGNCLRARSMTTQSARPGVAVGSLSKAVDRRLGSTSDADLESERTITTVWQC